MIIYNVASHSVFMKHKIKLTRDCLGQVAHVQGGKKSKEEKKIGPPLLNHGVGH